MILEKLKHQRKVVKKVTQVEMAEVLEMSRETYSRKERGVYDFTLKEFESAIKYLGLMIVIAEEV